MGKVEETIGNITGAESFKTSGQERRAQGDTEHREAQAQGYAEGTKDRLVGKKDQVAGAVTSDSSQETAGMLAFRSLGSDELEANQVILVRPCSQREGSDPARLEPVLACVHPTVGTTTLNV